MKRLSQTDVRREWFQLYSASEIY